MGLNPSGKSYTADSSRGIATYDFDNGEQCVIPKAFPLSDDQTASKKEEKLCGMDFYGSNVTLKPKANSTNPAVLLETPKKDGTLGVDAKYKQTITCSDTSSILVYGRMAEFLGVDLRVPDSVIRTMAIDEHKKVQASGVHTPIAQFWKLFPAYYAGTTKSQSNVVTSDGKYIYGALSENPKGESPYKEFNGPYVADYTARLELSVMRSQPFGVVSMAGPLTALFKGDKSLATVAQKTQWARDEADMIVMDTLFAQQDRPFNIAKEQRVAIVEGGKSRLIKLGDATDEQKKNGVVIDVLLMKDNDCGVSKSNTFTSKGVLERVRHMHPQTYERIMLLADKVAAEATGADKPLHDYFIKEMLFSEGDYKAFTKSLAHVHDVLKGNYDKGLLKLDASLDIQLGL